MPDYQMRIEIIEKKAYDHNLSLSEDVIHLLAKHLTCDIRQLESALKCLKARSDLLNAKIDLDLVRDELKCHVSEQDSTSFEDIKKVVCQYFKVDPVMLSSKSRKKIHSFPRNIYVYLCRHYTDATVEDIGKSINRNYSTVLYSSEVVEHKIKSDNKVKNQVNFLKQKLEDMTK